MTFFPKEVDVHRSVRRHNVVSNRRGYDEISIELFRHFLPYDFLRHQGISECQFQNHIHAGKLSSAIYPIYLSRTTLEASMTRRRRRSFSSPLPSSSSDV